MSNNTPISMKLENMKGSKGDKGEAGPQGLQGETGEAGFSPVILENSENTELDYRLDITTQDESFTTPNLKGEKGERGEKGDKGDPGSSGGNARYEPQYGCVLLAPNGIFGEAATGTIVVREGLSIKYPVGKDENGINQYIEHTVSEDTNAQVMMLGEGEPNGEFTAFLAWMEGEDGELVYIVALISEMEFLYKRLPEDRNKPAIYAYDTNLWYNGVDAIVPSGTNGFIPTAEVFIDNNVIVQVNPLSHSALDSRFLNSYNLQGLVEQGGNILNDISLMLTSSNDKYFCIVGYDSIYMEGIDGKQTTMSLESGFQDKGYAVLSANPERNYTPTEIARFKEILGIS